MHVFNLQKIAALSANRQVYLRGVSCYNAGLVRHTERYTGGVYEEILQAQVDADDRRQTYTCEVGFDYDGRAAHMTCSCPVYQSGSACKHIVAALVHKYYADMVGGMREAPIVRPSLPKQTDTVAASMIARYMDAGAARLAAHSVGEDAPLRLIPRLHIHGQAVSLSCSIARDKPYVLRDLRDFCAAVTEHRTVSYGKDLTVYHHPDRFAAEDRPLLRFIMGQLPPVPRGVVGGHAVRELELTPMALDVLLSMLRGRDAECRLYGAVHTVRVVREDPSVTVTVEQASDGMRLGMTPEPLTLCGSRRRYVWLNGTVYACSTRFAEQAGPLLDALQAAHGQLYIANKDLPELCMGAIKAASEVVSFVGDTAILENYAAQTPTAELYLDAPSANTVAAKLLFCYGERRVHAFVDEELDGVRRDTLEEYRLRLLVNAFFPEEGGADGRRMLSGDDERIYAFVTDGVATLGREMTVYATDRFKAIGVSAVPRVHIGVRMHSDLLEVEIGAEDMSEAEMEALLSSYREKRRYHRLASGGFLPLSDPTLQGLYAVASGAHDGAEVHGRMELPMFRALYLDRVLRDHPSLQLERDEGFRRLVRDINAAADNEYAPPASLGLVLRNYQKTGFRWLKTLERYHFGGILADDMGLGKTLQMISLLLDAKERGETRPSLVVCPASLVYNWQQEFARFAPSVKTAAIVGPKEVREQILNTTDADVWITSYDLLKRDLHLYESTVFAYHVLDEAQYIKNANTHAARATKRVRSEYRFALTGTPIENRLSELWSIFDFLMPGFLYSYARFRETLERPIVQDGDEEALRRLNRLVMPFVMRRLKKDVLAELPAKHESVVQVRLEDEQRELYRANLTLLRRELLENGLHRNHITVLSMLTRLRQLCCSPSLCYDDYAGVSAKTEACLELLREAIDGGHKVLLFSQFTSMLDQLAARLEKEGIAFYELRGSTTKEQRAQRVDAFNRDEVPVFLISLKAGGTGLNLTGADVVIHFDPWWNVSAQNQATDRAHRIGQTRTVQVYKLIAADTVEEKIVAMQERKQALAEAVVHEGDGILSGMTAEELLAILE